ncbi:MAG: amino acid ABC transporter permease [Clostridia bacterium]|nr:amino acid ABC transporter permease [Clostridia bacterium]
MAGKITPDRKISPIVKDFRRNFINGDRWRYLWNGLLVTLEITLFAVMLGIALGSFVAMVRSTWDQNSENMRPGAGRFLLNAGNKLCQIYLTVIRGTPVLIQLMIMYFIVFASSDNGRFVAILAFGINSGAYVAEIIRGGIMSIDHGQLEAGRSLGFNYVQTMGHVVLPQALKNVLPALANEFIVLLKETSVVGYVAEKDLTKGGDIIRSVTHSPFMPLLAVAAIYLILVMFFTWLVGKLERRLRSSDH